LIKGEQFLNPYYCPNCGNAVDYPQEEFCSNCGGVIIPQPECAEPESPLSEQLTGEEYELE
jgi:ribosomal protein S27AE